MDDTKILMLTQGELLGANLFAYCGNNPVMYSDPSGYARVVHPWGTYVFLYSYNDYKLLSMGQQSYLRYIAKGNWTLYNLYEASRQTGDKYLFNKILNSIKSNRVSIVSNIDNQAEVLARVIYGEDSGSYAGQRAVAATIYYRYKSNHSYFYNKYDRSPYGVVMQPRQFEALRIGPGLAPKSNNLWGNAKTLAVALYIGNFTYIQHHSPLKHGQLYFLSNSYFGRNTRIINGNVEYKMDGVWKRIKDIQKIGANTFFNLS